MPVSQKNCALTVNPHHDAVFRETIFIQQQRNLKLLYCGSFS